MVYRVVAKEGEENALRSIVRECVSYAHESKDCLYYTFFESLTKPGEFIVYYRFTNKAAQDVHIKHLQEKIGPAKEEGDLPIKFLNLVATEEIVFFENKPDARIY